MINSIVTHSVRARWFVVFVTAALALYGVWQLFLLPIDALPDITNKQVQINTLAAGLGPVEVEKRVTFPIETALAGLAVLSGSHLALPHALPPVRAALELAAVTVLGGAIVLVMLRALRVSELQTVLTRAARMLHR